MPIQGGQQNDIDVVHGSGSVMGKSQHDSSINKTAAAVTMVVKKHHHQTSVEGDDTAEQQNGMMMTPVDSNSSCQDTDSTCSSDDTPNSGEEEVGDTMVELSDNKAVTMISSSRTEDEADADKQQQEQEQNPLVVTAPLSFAQLNNEEHTESEATKNITTMTSTQGSTLRPAKTIHPTAGTSTPAATTNGAVGMSRGGVTPAKTSNSKAGGIRSSNFSVQAIMALSQSLEGRDSMTKLLQYGSRFGAWWLRMVVETALTTSSSSRSISSVIEFRRRFLLALASRLQALKDSLSTSRKAYRLGKSLIECQKIYDMGVIETIVNRNMTTTSVSKPLWKVLGTALRVLTLGGFFLSDNVVFLSSFGVIGGWDISSEDAYNNKDQQSRQRKQLQKRAQTFGNRCYFVSSLLNGLLNLQACLALQQKMKTDNLRSSSSTTAEDEKTKEQEMRQKQRKQLTMMVLALVKSTCDAIAFSNNSGVDLWMKTRGSKLNDGIHSLAGMISASTVIYKNLAMKK